MLGWEEPWPEHEELTLTVQREPRKEEDHNPNHAGSTGDIGGQRIPTMRHADHVEHGDGDDHTERHEDNHAKVY